MTVTLSTLLSFITRRISTHESTIKFMSWFSIIKWAQISHVAFLLTWDLLFENLIFMLLLVYPTLEYWCNMHSIKYIISSKWSAFHQEILVCMKGAHGAVYAKTETSSLCTPVIHSKSFSAPFCPKEIMIGIEDDKTYAKAYVCISNTYYPFPCTSNQNISLKIKTNY